MIRYSKATKEKAIELYKSGLTCTNISKIIGCTAKTVWDWAKALGVLRPPKVVDPDYFKKYRQKNKAMIAKKSKIYREKNKEKLKQKYADYCKNNRHKINAYFRKIRKDNPSYKLSGNISCLMRQSIKNNKNGYSWEKLVGYKLSDLKKHLESLFSEGMNWGNYGKDGWHIDHIIPRVAFNFDCPENPDFMRCWSLDNLQPLWEKDNLRKHSKIKKPFQPLLKLKPA